MTEERTLDWFLRLTTGEQLAFLIEHAGPLTGDDLIQAAGKKKAEEYLARRAGIPVPSFTETLREFQAKFDDVDEDEIFRILEKKNQPELPTTSGRRSTKSRRASVSTPTA